MVNTPIGPKLASHRSRRGIDDIRLPTHRQNAQSPRSMYLTVATLLMAGRGRTTD